MRVMLALLFLLNLYFFPAVIRADPLPTAKELQDRSDAASGPVPPDYRETIVGTGSLGDTKVVTFHSGADERRVYERGSLHSEAGTYHGEKWEQNENGLVFVSEPDPKNAVKDSTTVTVTHVMQPFDAYVVAELNARAAGTRTYYDAQTFHRLRVENVGAAGTTVTTYDEFGPFGGRTLPIRWSVSSKEAHLDMKYVRSEYVMNGANDADIQEANTRRSLVEFPAGVNALDLPVTIIDRGVGQASYGHAIYVRVGIGSRAVDFELDTGASGIMIDDQLARDLGLPFTNATSTVTAARYTTYVTTVPELRIGGLTMHNIAVGIVPMPAVHGDGAKPLGLLGFDFLAQLGVTIDYQRKIVRVTPADDYTAPTDRSTFAFDVRLGSGVPMVSASVAGAVADRVVVDTGMSGQLGFFDYFARRYPNVFQEDLGSSQGYGVGGPVRVEWFRFHDVELGPIRFRDYFGMRSPASSYPYAVDGLLGNDLLSMFTVGLDYTSGRIYLTPNDAAKQAMR
jgi:predicted aspartyl protease